MVRKFGFTMIAIVGISTWGGCQMPFGGSGGCSGGSCNSCSGGSCPVGASNYSPAPNGGYAPAPSQDSYSGGGSGSR